MIEGVINGLILLEVVVATWLSVRNIREVRFLYRLRPLMPDDADLPLFDALANRAWLMTFTGIYLLVVTLLGAFGISVATAFPPIRVINGVLLLAVIAGPAYVGRALRRAAAEKVGRAQGEPQ